MRVPGRTRIAPDPVIERHPDDAGEAARSRRWTRAVAVAILAAVVAVVALIATGALSSGGGASNASALSKAVGTTPITRRDLVEQDSESGTLGYADTRNVINRLSGTITWLPASGTVIAQGQDLFHVDATPVVLLNGSTPAYRALSSTDSAGPDIGQLKADLRALGYDPSGAIGSGDAWDGATTAAVNRFQAAHGLTQTGSLELGRVVFLPSPRRVGTLLVSVGSSGGGGGATSNGTGSTTGASTGSGSTTGASARGSTGTVQTIPAAYVTSAAAPTSAPPATTPNTGTTTPTTTTPTTPTPTTPTPGTGTTAPAKPVTKPRKKSSKPKTRQPTSSGGGSGGSTGRTAAGSSSGAAARSAASSSASGTGAAAAAGSGSASTPVMTTSATRQVVTVAIDTGKASVARAGERVTVQLPSGANIHGSVTSVGKVAQSTSSSTGSGGGGGSSSGSGATLSVTIAVSAGGQHLDQAPVTVLFEQSRVRNVLAIPVTALIATPGGGFAVEVVDASGHHQVPVTPGLYTSGYVQIDGAVQEGEQVTNASG
jgi:hypothetical protein